MSSTGKETSKKIVEEVLGKARVEEIWSGNYNKALPVSIQNFDLGAVFPAVFYMFRYGFRRGKGKFLETFRKEESAKEVKIQDIALKLSQDDSNFQGFLEPVGQAILGDLLLSFCFENKKNAMGREEPVARVAPVHYFSAHIDLPDEVGNLRYVPEMIVSMLADQPGEFVKMTQEKEKTWFPVGKRFDQNLLLKGFRKGVVRREPFSDHSSDRFDEKTLVGIDELLMIRVAQNLKQAPSKQREEKGGNIPNQFPIASHATRKFSEDLRSFTQAYSGNIPRQAFVPLLESCIAVGLSSVIFNVFKLLLNWGETGEIIPKQNQKPVEFFVDCSNGTNKDLRKLAEASFDDFLRQIKRIPVILMALRILDYETMHDPECREKIKNIPTSPDATEWINFLGKLLFERIEESKMLFYDLNKRSSELAERLKKEEFAETAEILENIDAQKNPVWRLAEALTLLQGTGNTDGKISKMIYSATFAERPNGLLFKRTIKKGGSNRQTRYLIFTDSVLEYLVHRHLLNNKKEYRSLSFFKFLETLQKRYGFCVNKAPHGMEISNELLQKNRSILEHRLRDLGILIGVNDAEGMKYLKPRFKLEKEVSNGAE
jgi:hypothetical protein